MPGPGAFFMLLLTSSLTSSFPFLSNPLPGCLSSESDDVFLLDFLSVNFIKRGMFFHALFSTGLDSNDTFIVKQPSVPVSNYVLITCHLSDYTIIVLNAPYFGAMAAKISSSSLRFLCLYPDHRQVIVLMYNSTTYNTNNTYNTQYKYLRGKYICLSFQLQSHFFIIHIICS